eukprot:CAMPEP_0168199872 /NCGR_PEP_ID=MMETSP0139_2-20121125/22709_1 /TAXON_ID=44445 /ORGANISM="Pseudo-nitzschia australis, Strain 10249 10 AB" /LENGTH=274 /DNA_ID=CAMNT_0008124999 /DNA_START=11 /DNA_END=832 /DNA_ORIENTATION=+
MKLVPCDEDLCKSGGTFYDDIGWVNRSPYLAFGGWACAVNNYATPERKTLATEFCAYVSSRKQSTAVPGPDPFRKSQLNIALWTKNGYETTSVIKYFNTISKALKSENAMADIRFPISTDVYQHLDNKAHHYLKRTATNNISESERSNAREAIADSLTKKFNAMVKSYDSKASPKSLLLEQYRKLRGTHAIILNMNYLENPLRYYGYTIGILTTVLALGFGILTYRRRSSLVIKASQPFFLILVCVGVFIFSSSIFPLTIDDEFSSVEACSKCM